MNAVPKTVAVSTCACNFASGRSFPEAEEWLFLDALRVEHECEGLSERYNVTRLTVGLRARPKSATVGFQKLASGPRAHRATPLVLSSAGRNSEFDGLSQSTGSVESAAASGFLLMTNSRLSPASIIRGTVRQQSKSLVLTWFTCRNRVN